MHTENTGKISSIPWNSSDFEAIFISQNLAEKTGKLAIVITEERISIFCAFSRGIRWTLDCGFAAPGNPWRLFKTQPLLTGRLSSTQKPYGIRRDAGAPDTLPTCNLPVIFL